MDMITNSLLDEFSTEHELRGLPRDQQFEHFAAYITVRRHYSETFDTEDLLTGSGGDTGIDAIAVIVNGKLVTDDDDIEALAAQASYLDVAFIFVQAEQSPGFDGASMGTFGFGVRDFFQQRPKLARSERISDAARLMKSIYAKSGKFKRGNPSCRLYYVTTGKWVDDANLVARKAAAIADLENVGVFSRVEFTPIGADAIHRLYREAKNAIAREFQFLKRTTIPPIDGISDAHIGVIPATELLKILANEDGDITKSIFYDNVRDWQGDNEVNTEIRSTLISPQSARFALMNNGITIIARELRITGDSFHIEDFQIVNGCQTCHVLFSVAEDLTDLSAVMVPLRVISTNDEAVINAVIRATNRQTQVREDQFFALTDFPKKVEAFFNAQPDKHRLYFERRSRQYDSLAIEKTRIVTQDMLTKAFAAMFLNEPHGTTKSAKAIKAKLGSDIGHPDHRLEPYYTAAFALYRLEYLFRSHRIDTRFKPARFQALYALRLLLEVGEMPRLNANAMERYCKGILVTLWDMGKAEAAFNQAIGAIEAAAGGSLDRDRVRTLPFTKDVAAACAKRRS